MMVVGGKKVTQRAQGRQQRELERCCCSRRRARARDAENDSDTQRSHGHHARSPADRVAATIFSVLTSCMRPEMSALGSQRSAKGICTGLTAMMMAAAAAPRMRRP